MKNISKIFKAYDIRGVYPEEINETLAYRIGQAYAKVVKPKEVVVGMDVRVHSEKLKQSLIKGLIDSGCNVTDIGLVSTEMLYFAVGKYGYNGGIQVTASHNTAEYNGFKMTRDQVIPISSETGISEIRDLVLSEKDFIFRGDKGFLKKRDILTDFASFVLNFVDYKKIKPLKVAYNPNFGFAGKVLEEIVRIGDLKLDLYGLNNTIDGSFPKGQPDPFKEENRPEFIDFVKKNNVDIGVAWDADADRVFFCSRLGKFIDPYYMNVVLARRMLKQDRGAKIIYDPRYTWALIDTAKEFNGQAIIERVGHSFIKDRMRKENAVFAGESSGHTYFRDFWFADSGMIPLLMVLDIISSGENIEETIKLLAEKYFISGEISLKMKDKNTFIEKLKKRYSHLKFLEIDGISFEDDIWRANIRGSNTEPLVRINIEGKNEDIVKQKKEEILSMV
jgi:phosphomannomutase